MKLTVPAIHPCQRFPPRARLRPNSRSARYLWKRRGGCARTVRRRRRQLSTQWHISRHYPRGNVCSSGPNPGSQVLMLTPFLDEKPWPQPLHFGQARSTAFSDQHVWQLLRPAFHSQDVLGAGGNTYLVPSCKYAGQCKRVNYETRRPSMVRPDHGRLARKDQALTIMGT